MNELFLNSLIALLIFTPFGVYFTETNKNTLYYYTKSLIFGIILISFIAILINFFYPLTQVINSSLIIISILIIIFKWKHFYKLEFVFFIILGSLLISILIFESNVYRPDAGLYHLPFIGILNSEKIIIGLSNLHFRYGHTSIIQYTSAISNNSLLGNNGIVYAQALIAIGVLINFVSQIYFYNKEKKYNLHFFFLLFVFIYFFYKMNRYSEYGNDAPAHFLVFFLISEIILNKNLIRTNNFLNNLILTFFIIMNKPTLMLITLINLINIRKIDFKEILVEKKTYLLIIFFSIAIIKNILISGCMIYPLKATCFNELSWVDMESIEKVSIDSEAWTKGISDLSKEKRDKFINEYEFINKFNWLNAWSIKHLKYILEILLPYIIFCSLLIIFLKHKSLKKNYKSEIKLKQITFILFFCTLIWFYKSPLYRYGYSYIISLFSIIFSYIIMKYNFNIKKIYVSSLLILMIGFSVIVSKNFLRIYNTPNNYKNYPWPKYFSMTNDNNKNEYRKIKINNRDIFVPIENYCMYIKKTCTQYSINPNLDIKKLLNYEVIYLKKD